MDESRSMRSRNVLKVLKDYMNQLVKNNLVDTNTVVSVWKFGTNVSRVQNITHPNFIYEFYDFTPDGGSALYDCMYEAICQNYEHSNVTFVTLTDGLDNLSIDVDKDVIINTILEMETEKGWGFVFLDKGVDDFQSVVDERVEFQEIGLLPPQKLVRYEYCGSPNDDRSFFQGEKLEFPLPIVKDVDVDYHGAYVYDATYQDVIVHEY